MPPSKDDIMDYRLLDSKLETVAEDVKEIKETLRGNYVTTHEFQPVKLITYSLVGTILLSVLGALLALVMRGH